jgi:hypothetical protein
LVFDAAITSLAGRVDEGRGGSHSAFSVLGFTASQPASQPGALQGKLLQGQERRARVLPEQRARALTVNAAESVAAARRDARAGRASLAQQPRGGPLLRSAPLPPCVAKRRRTFVRCDIPVPHCVVADGGRTKKKKGQVSIASGKPGLGFDLESWLLFDAIVHIFYWLLCTLPSRACT